MKKDLYLEAVKAFARHCKNGTPVLFSDGEYRILSYFEPSEGCSNVGRKFVHLRNHYGLYAKYDIKHKKMIAV